MVSSSFTGWNNYMTDFGKLAADPEAMKRFGNTVLVWNLHARKPRKVLDVLLTPRPLVRCRSRGVEQHQISAVLGGSRSSPRWQRQARPGAPR